MARFQAASGCTRTTTATWPARTASPNPHHAASAASSVPSRWLPLPSRPTNSASQRWVSPAASRSCCHGCPKPCWRWHSTCRWCYSPMARCLPVSASNVPPSWPIRTLPCRSPSIPTCPTSTTWPAGPTTSPRSSRQYLGWSRAGYKFASPPPLRAPFDDPALDPLRELVASLGVAADDHLVRPIVRRGRADEFGLGVRAVARDIPSELTITADGAFWGSFGPTVRNGRLDTDLLLTRTILPLSIPATALLAAIGELPEGADARLGIH